jgi:hypothetical protein
MEMANRKLQIKKSGPLRNQELLYKNRASPIISNTS